MEIRLIAQTKRVKRPISKDHYWYDSETKQMLYGHGGRMNFVYDPIRGKSVPVITDYEDWVNETNYQDILKWVYSRSYLFEADIISRADKFHVILDIPVYHVEGASNDLLRHKILFDWEEMDERN